MAKRFGKRHLVLGAIIFWGFFLVYALHFKTAEKEGETLPALTGEPDKTDIALEPYSKVGFSGPEDLADWKEHIFQGQSDFQVLQDEAGGYFLQASSGGTSSVIFTGIDVPLGKHPRLRWNWRVLRFPCNKKNERFVQGRDNDFGARLYVVFEGLNYFLSPTIQYVWDDHFPEGTRATSRFARHVKYLVIEKGPVENPNTWVEEERDIVKDYEMLFGKPPKRPLHAIGIMSDSDDTGTRSSAQFRDIWLLVPKGKSNS